ENALYILNGEEVDKQIIDQINPSDIYAVTVLKQGTFTKYGEKGRNGVVEITTKTIDVKQIDGINLRDPSILITTTDVTNKPLIYVDGKISNNINDLERED